MLRGVACCMNIPVTTKWLSNGNPATLVISTTYLDSRFRGNEEKETFLTSTKYMKIRTYNVAPRLPEPVQHLHDIAMNTWFCWNPAATMLFSRLDPVEWEKCRNNPIEMLGRLPARIIHEASSDDSFLANLDNVWKMMQTYLQSKTWYSETHADERRHMLTAYFSMEFGIDVSLPIYSGGLGVLSGDHLKSSSDLGIPLIGVGLLYQHGFFQQYLSPDGWQGERYLANDWYNMPVKMLRDDQGNPVSVGIDIAGEKLLARIWKVEVGRVHLFLLDTNTPENPPHLRRITDQLYIDDRELRLRQEILLGIGGIRALKTLGYKPTVFHMNEGHSAFLTFERLRECVSENHMTFPQAKEIVWASTVFTTHTPVKAGHEAFHTDLMLRHFDKFAEQIGLTWENFLELGQENPGDANFSMTILALRFAAQCNGVSKLHGVTSRRMWNKLWRGLPEKEVPIGHITNGIHTRSWISRGMDDLLQRYIGPQFVDDPHDHRLWERIENIPDGELWRVHKINKERLIFFTRKMLKKQLKNRGKSASTIRNADEVLNSNALTIGFARRFATYKRADLILRDSDRLRGLLTDPDKPVQIIFAGKAHPQDNAGKELIRQIVRYASDPELRNHVVFIEDYDINVARYLVQGVDVWLSTPRRPLEASATSGMKAVANGGINIGTLDGWWAECCSPDVGWAIGVGKVYDNLEEQDAFESESLYHNLEDEVVPLFYDRDRTDLPCKWISMMKRSMIKLGGYFNTNRMLMEYCENYYVPAHRSVQRLLENDARKAGELALWREKVLDKWDAVSIKTDPVNTENEPETGENIQVTVTARLNGLPPDEVAVELMYGLMDTDGNIADGQVVLASFVGDNDGEGLFSGTIPCETAGRMGFAARIRPHHPDSVHPFTPLLLKWEEGSD